MTKDMIVIGAKGLLSRRKARKLAYLYRGSRRGQWYANYLAGNQAGFYICRTRLRRLPKAGRISFVTVHAESPVMVIRNAMAGAKSYSIEDPPEYRISGVTSYPY